MSPEETPSEKIVPVPTPVPAAGPTSGEAVAEHYVADQLLSARASLQRTRLIGIVLMVVVVGYLSYLTIKFQQELRPESAAQTTNGLISQQIEQSGPELAEQTKERVLAMIAELPDYAMAQMPMYRTALEDQLEADMQKYFQSTADLLGDHLDVFLEENKDKIKEILTTGQDREAVRELGDELEQQLIEYLKEKPAGGGESVQEQINKSLSALHEVQSTVRRLANAKDLNPQEKKARRAIALIAKTAEDELKDFSIKEISFDKLPINLPTSQGAEDTTVGTSATGTTAAGTTATGTTGTPAVKASAGVAPKTGQGAAGVANSAAPGKAAE